MTKISIFKTVLIIEIANELPNTKAGNHLPGQLVRSGTSPALNYGEAQKNMEKINQK